MTPKAVLDSSAWFHLLQGTKPGERVKTLLQATDSQQIVTPTIIVAEVLGVLRRRGGSPLTFQSALTQHSTLEPLTQAVAELAGELYGRLKRDHPGLSLVDAVVLAHARTLAAPLWTSDRELASQEGVEPLE